MIMNKSVCFVIAILLFYFCEKCSTNQLENVKFITKSEQKRSEDWESDIVELKFSENEKFDLARPQVSEDLKYDQNVENTELLFTDDEIEMNEKFNKDVNTVDKKRIVRQINNVYSGIYPTLTPQNPYAPVYPTPYRPAGGLPYGNLPNNYTSSNQNSYNQSYSRSNYNHNNTTFNPVSFRPPYSPQAQNPFLRNTSYSNPGYYNQGSAYNNKSNTNGFTSNNIQYPQYSQNSNQRYNSSPGQPNQYYNNYASANNSNPGAQGTYPQQGTNVNQNMIVSTPANLHSYNPKYPYNNPSNSFTNFNYSTPHTGINVPPNPTNKYPPYQSNPLYNTTTNTYSQQNYYNRSNQWSSSSSTQTPYTGNNYPAYIPTNGRTSNYTHQNYPAINPSSYPTQRPYSPNSLPNPYSQNYPVVPNGNQNNQYNREPGHFFYTPGNKNY